MEIRQDLAGLTPEKETLLTIGVFDGVHAGHRYLIEKLNQQARGKNQLSGVVTFNPHPQSVLQPHNKLTWLSSLEDRIKSLQELGVALVTVLSFTPELSQLSAQEFVALLKKHLNMCGLVIGPDFTLGKGREGDASLLRSLSQEMKFSVEIISPFTLNDAIVSSTLIRQTLAQGDVMKVRKLMGRHFTLSARVVPADKRGRKLGFPTANLDIKPGQALPSNGVYATVTPIDNKQSISVTYIGTRPTFGKGEKSVETHLLNYEGNLYGKELKVEFIDRLRDEKHFASPQELKSQIKKDIKRVSITTHK